MITHIPASSPEPSINSIMFKNPEINVKSLNNSLLSETSFISLRALEMFENMNNENDTFNVLEEIMAHDDFNDSLKSVVCDDLSTDTLKNENKINELIKSDSEKNHGIEEVLSARDFFPFAPEIDSLKEVNSSNQSTTSLGTSTDYKLYHDKSFTGVSYF